MTKDFQTRIETWCPVLARRVINKSLTLSGAASIAVDLFGEEYGNQDSSSRHKAHNIACEKIRMHIESSRDTISENLSNNETWQVYR